MSRVVVNLPQTDAVGLSECWLLKHCGDLHWRRLCESMKVAHVESPELCDAEGNLLYPTFVALRARYDAPLSRIRLGEQFETSAELTRFGRSFYGSRIELVDGRRRLRVEMLSAFAARHPGDGRQLRQTSPRPGMQSSAEAMPHPPELLVACQALRRGTRTRYELAGHEFAPHQATCDLTERCEPSPYVDFNGAGLLYFASYPALTDALERRIIRAHALLPGECDWALASSTVARDVFYHGNLGLGREVVAHLKRYDRVGEHVILHTELLADDGRKLADVLTAKRLISSARRVPGKSEAV